MTLAVTAADANRNFSRLLGDVKRGQSVTITSHGRPVAKLIPIDDGADERRQARADLLAHLAEVRKRPIQVVGPWTRDDLYDV